MRFFKSLIKFFLKYSAEGKKVNQKSSDKLTKRASEPILR